MKNEVIRTEFGAVLRRMRLKCDLTQQAVADALHVNRATYSYYELEKPSPILSSWAISPRSLASHERPFPLTWNTRNSQPIGGSPSAHRKKPPRSQTHWDSFGQRKSPSSRYTACAANRTKKLFGNLSINLCPRTHLDFWLCCYPPQREMAPQFVSCTNLRDVVKCCYGW